MIQKDKIYMPYEPKKIVRFCHTISRNTSHNLIGQNYTIQILVGLSSGKNVKTPNFPRKYDVLM